MSPIVLVHGNPETPAIWGPLIAHLGHDLVIHTPRLPGFGSPVPAGFGATHREYIDWLINEVESIGEPVHLVGHDWGGGLAIPLACERPDLLVSWAADVVGLFDADYTWHDMAQAWQTPETGEAAIAMMISPTVEERTALFESLGMPPDVAGDVASALTDETGRCILSLYRSATQPAMADYAAEHLAAAAQRPGLCVIPTEDPYTGGAGKAMRAAHIAGARTHELNGRGHWWMLESPSDGAAMLTDFWSGV